MSFFDIRPHARLQRQLGAFVDGSLDAARDTQVRRHVDACAACKEHVAHLRGLRTALRSLPHPPVPRSFRLTPAMLATTAPAVAPSRVARPAFQAPPWARAGMRVTGTLAAVVLAVLVVVDLTPGSGSSPESAVSMAGAPVADGVAAAGGAPQATSPAFAPQPTAPSTGPPASTVEGYADSGVSNSGGETTPAARDERSLPGVPVHDATAFKASAPSDDRGGISGIRLAQAAAAIVAIAAVAASFLLPASQRKERP